MQNVTGKQHSFDNEVGEKLVAQRSKSAPQRRKWFRKVTKHEPVHSFLMDQMISTRLVGAINIWHDIHSNLIQLNVRKTSCNTNKERDSIISNISDCAHSDSCVSYNNHNFEDTLSMESLLCESLPDISFSDTSESEDEAISSNINKNMTPFGANINILDDNECINSLSVQVINAEEGEWGRQNTLNSTVTKEQMKTTLPELSDHWR
uniref:DDE_Tnp_1_7 domain-containing protein n=1 Tax=Parastrongyloides trichosuri TaxID=131310 RepID=A0A0N4ZBI2_PARTI